MAKTFPLKIIAINRVFYDDDALQVIFPASDGLRGIMADHVRSYMSVRVGDLKIQKPDGTWIEAVTGRGYVQVAHHRVSIVVDSVELPEEIDINRAQQAKERAEEQLREKQSYLEYQISKANLSRAMARLSSVSKRNREI